MRSLLFASLLFLSAPTAAEVVSVGTNAFEISHSANLTIPPGQAYAAFGRLGSWWSDGHSYSGKAANMQLDLRPGGCLCESIPTGGGVEHLRVAVVLPGERIVMTGGLGPLLYEAASGVMDIRFEPIAGGTKVTMNYRVAGFARGNAATMAPLVDAVLAEQMQRFSVYAAK